MASNWIGYAVNPLRSRKVRVAAAVVVAAYAAQWLPHIHVETIYTILGVGVALILGIAHEDNGKHQAGEEVGPQIEDFLKKTLDAGEGKSE